MASTVIESVTVPWIPVAHRMDVLLCDELPHGYTVTTAFVLTTDSARRTLLTRVDAPGRSWDVPGGHIDPGEPPVAAAARELAEETGLRLDAERLRLLGGQRITLLAEPPAGYRYPARAFMAFYTAALPHEGAPTSPHPEYECGAAEWCSREEVRRRCPDAVWHPLHDALFR